jgi:hypothetical protein
VTVISSRSPSDTQTSELLKNVFHLDSLRRGDRQLAFNICGHRCRLPGRSTDSLSCASHRRVFWIVVAFRSRVYWFSSAGRFRRRKRSTSVASRHQNLWNRLRPPEPFTEDAGFDYFRIQAPLGHKLFTLISDDVKDVIYRRR